MPMAYRVEYPPYKIKLKADGKIAGFEDGGEGDPTISISFESPDHSEYFVRERKPNPGLRVVEFEITQDCWDAIQWKAVGKPKKAEVKSSWVDRVQYLPDPSWSDGASLSKYVKQRALTFSGEKWMDALIAGVDKSRKAGVDYPGDDESGLKDDSEVWAYYEGEEADGWVTTKDKQSDEGFELMTIFKAMRLGYKTS